MQLLDAHNDLLNLLVAKFQGFHNFLFGNFEGSRFHHHDAFFRAGHDNIQLAGLLLGHRRIGYPVSIQQSHTYRGNGIRKGQVRTIGGCGGGGQGNHVWVIGAIGRQHQGDNLRFIPQ